MAVLSQAKNLFDQAIASGAPFLRQLVADKTPESEWLDFKYGDHLDDSETKVTWSRALCGFANNEGGVLIWGIDARFDKATKVDVANDVRLVPNPEALRDRLRQLHPTATDPPLIGVESKAIFDNGSTGPGFVVSYVPESDVKPHRAELMEGKPYMLRIGDTFKNPSPAILRNLFFPRSSARVLA
jgi:predicted HTH transcriptional regulator